MSNQPFLSVVTPVFNGEPFLAEAIESVLNQSYADWEYIIVNNRSTDGTLSVAESYARRDPRIRVITTSTHVNCEQNHNNAFREISAKSRFCKVVSADDWLLPDALSKLLSIAIDNPTVGVVGSYQERMGSVRWKGLPEDVVVLSGREVCRMGLLNNVHIMGNPMSVLYRSDLVRRTDSFFPHDRPHADTSACYSVLRESDLGFVHEVLSVERAHPGQETCLVNVLDADMTAYVELLLEFGPTYLTPDELARRRVELLTQYYRLLARAALLRKGDEYWKFHCESLRALGHELDRGRLGGEVIKLILRQLLEPKLALRRFRTIRASWN